MKIYLIAVGAKMPKWVSDGYEEYASRFASKIQLELIQVSAEKRTRNSDIHKICEKESEKLVNAIPANCHVVALDVQGQKWSTEKLAQQLESWMMCGRDIALLVGGPEGMTAICKQRADQVWSLSPLTFPHPLVRVIVAEQLYRAWTITENHPYHRSG